MKCISCKEDIIENSPYCPYCGEAQPISQKETEELYISYETSDTEINKENEAELNIKNTSSLTTTQSVQNDSEHTYTLQKEEDSSGSAAGASPLSLDEHQSSKELTTTGDSSDSFEEHLAQNGTPSNNDVSRKKPFFLSFRKAKQEPEEPPLVNDDGYYTELNPTKNEKFPVSKGEIAAKFILLGLLLISLALFMIYVIQ